MELTFYKLQKRTNSTKQPSANDAPLVVNGILLKEGVSIYTPSFIVKSAIKAYNYIKWVDGNTTRYYFVNDYVYLRNEVYEISCSMDYLATYKSTVTNTNALIKYSTYGNPYIYDHRIPESGNITKTTIQSRLYDDGATELIAPIGSYILNYVSNDGEGYICLTKPQLNQVVAVLGNNASNGFLAWLRSTQYSLVGAYDAILGCHWLPFAVSDGNNKSLKLAGFDTGITGLDIQRQISFSTTITIPLVYSDKLDFRNWNCRDFVLELPFYGFIQLDPNELKETRMVNIELWLDGRTGNGFYIINGKSKYPVSFATYIQLGMIKNPNVITMASGAISATAQALSGNAVGATASVLGTTQQMRREVGVVGSSGSWAESDYNHGYVYLHIFEHPLVDAVANYKGVIGIPNGKMAYIYSLGNGYVQTEGASVNTGIESVNGILNNFLDGGIYIE